MVKKEYIKQAEFCRRLNITKAALQKALNNGRVVKCPKTSRIEWNSQSKAFIDTSDKKDRFNNRLNPKPNKSKINIDKLKESEEDKEVKEGMSRAEAETIKQVYLAKQAKLKYFLDSGVLIETESVKEDWKAIALKVKKAMLSIPDRVSEMFSTMDDAHLIHQELTNEIIHALSNLRYNNKKINGKKVLEPVENAKS